MICMDYICVIHEYETYLYTHTYIKSQTFYINKGDIELLLHLLNLLSSGDQTHNRLICKLDSCLL